MRLLKDKKIIDALKCPICGEKIRVSDIGSGSILCFGKKTHCYDIAASGYVNFSSPSQSGGGDSKSAVRARSSFLDTGAYKPVADAICNVLDKCCNKDSLVIDAGCGEGYYSCLIAEKGFSVYGADISKIAVDVASRRAVRNGIENAFFSTASVFELPIVDSSADAVVNIFAPCAENEYLRVLRNDGILVVAWAGEKHLMGLKNAIYDEARSNTERADMPRQMELLTQTRVNYEIELTSNEQIQNLFSMTPYYWRTSVEDKKKLADISKLTTDVDVIISVFGKNSNRLTDN